jgi:endonuclease III related protein
MKKQSLFSIYESLLRTYGKQGWWPVTRRGHLPEYFVKDHDDRQRLEIIIGAILTQNTAWRPNVERAIANLNKEGMIDIGKILAAGQDEIASLIRSAGYFNQKAIKLKAAAEFLGKIPLKKLMKMDLRKARDLLLKVKGIGPETADSILLYALDKPIFVVDAYTKRMFARLGFFREGASYSAVQDLFMEELPSDVELFREYHALIVEHSKHACRSKPDCSECPYGCLQKSAGDRLIAEE